MISTIVHKITAFTLVFILLAQNINTLVIVGEFIVNQDIIAKTLCIQKDQQKGCNGKCQLRKELKENTTDSNSEFPLQHSKRLSLDIFFVSSINRLDNQFEYEYIKRGPIIFKTPIMQKIYHEIDTPPPIVI